MEKFYKKFRNVFKEKIVIPEKIAIRLLNSSEVTAEQFYRHILEQYRILNQLQQQRQIFLQKQHLQLQQLAAGNKFQEVFATATIIQPNSHDLNKKPITPTNGTFLLEPPRLPPIPGMDTIHVPILDTTPMRYRRKQHRKHYSHHNRHSGSTNINNQRRSHKRPSTDINKPINEPPLSPSTSIVKEIAPYTAMPIPLILNSQEDKRPLYTQSEKKSNSLAMSHKRITSSGYDTQPYLNPFLTGELIFEK
ncbi:uncharacterized protein LOC119671822 isoform X2 [Teleopsis dalmanni]|uniref:uncharacterized protein LOC119671822 isoform X2 n=1 Tax=Teleopsis dalmanni TaxID=139649 RepID=UPI0018CD0F7E|nr:uncharacterized protein LOC119671822 isoform X2 [Teleopsis dalmanni]